jgi:hypothetical protein
MKRIWTLLAAGAALGGCSGTIELTPLDPATLGKPAIVGDIHADNVDSGYHGLLVYLPTQVLEVDQFTQIQTASADGKTMLLSGECDRSKAYVQKIVTIVDRAHPYLLQYHHGLLETYTFAATLTADGALASINTSSTPDQGKTLANLSAAAVSAGGLTKLSVGPERQPVCTQTPTFVRYDPLPKLPAGGTP